MGRGPKPTKGQAKPAGFRKSPESDGPRVRDLETRLAEALKDKAEAQEQQAEAREQQTATAEILRIISSSPGDAQPVFDAIAVNALRLCDAEGVVVTRYDGTLLRVAALHNVNREAVDRIERQYPRAPSRDLPAGRAILDGVVVHVPDLQAAIEFASSVPRQSGAGSHISIPLLHQGRAIGVIGISRRRRGPFPDRHIELLKTFADQAVIAIENVRLFKELDARNNELRSSLERQTATSEILRVISTSPTDTQPVFDTIVESAARLCHGAYSSLASFDGETVQLLAAHNWPSAAFDLARRITGRPPHRGSMLGRAILDRTVVHVPDIELDREWAYPELSREIGLRSALAVPMIRDGVPLGVIGVGRAEPGPFSDNQIALLQTFADQAVIAIENVRLFTELRASNRNLTTALDTQTATSDILRVISRSQTNVQPVFDAIVQSAVRLLGGYSSMLTQVANDRLELAARTSTVEVDDTALKEFWPRPFPSDGVHTLAIRERAPVNIADVPNDPRVPEAGRTIVRALGYHSLIIVPLLRHDAAIGSLGVTRRESGGFTDDEIALLQTFADQAVIAIENVRLFTETKEALEQQTATSEILKVISSSPTDVQPVFDAIVRSAMRLLGGWNVSARRLVGDELVLAAFSTTSDSGDKVLRSRSRISLTDEPVLMQVVHNRVPLVVRDTETDPTLGSKTREQARARGFRSLLVVPLLHESHVIGTLGVGRREPGPFTDDQVALLQTFADQAVIAIENVRLFTELQKKNSALTETLDQQTATSEILRVISSSPTAVEPVFATIVKNATRLCEAYDAALNVVEGGVVVVVAHEGPIAVPPAFIRRSITRDFVRGRAVIDRRPIQVEDLAEVDTAEYPEARLAVENGIRSILAVPLLLQDAAIGVLVVRAREPRRFSDKHLVLLQTFADQAVIAIENVRLFNELEARNRDLTEALKQQTATSEILRVISQSPTEVQPVFNAILASGVRLCGARYGGVFRFDGELIHLVTSYEWPPERLDAIRRRFPMPPGDGSLAARAIRDRRVVQTADYVADSRAGALPHWVPGAEQQPRGTIAIPMLREGGPIGAIVLARDEPGLFSDQHVALLQTFADQAVIAIENVRLFNELETRNRDLTESLEQQTATSEILRVISSSPTDIQPVVDSIAAKALDLCQAKTGAVFRFDGELIHVVAAHSFSPEAVQAHRQTYPIPPGRGGTTARAILSGAVVYIPDIREDPQYEHQALATATGYLSALSVPMLHESRPVGAITVTRAEAGAFSERQIELLKTFADQAVIAIENVRLFKELQEKNEALTQAHAQVTESLDQQTATSEILRAISQSHSDVQPIFETITRNATRLCDGVFSSLYQFDGEVFDQVAQYNYTPEALAEVRRTFPMRPTRALAAGRAVLDGVVVELPDIDLEPGYRAAIARAVGSRSVLAVPMLRYGVPVGAIVVGRAEAGRFSSTQIELLQTFADQAVIAIENVRLFKELEVANRELAAASQHKSEFLANMSHELRTPLNAIIGFSEVLSEKMFGELNEKQEEYSKDIHASGQHLLSLINDILDLSKIEAGRMELELSDFHLPTALDSALTLVRERAGRRGIALHMNVDNRLGQIQADERKIRQVVLNLFSNAIKFTPEGGSIEVRATPQDGLVEVSVTDTGVGIAPEDQEAVFEEFRQVGTADKKVEGTGLGLTLCRKFVELHGGKIWVKSQLGAGSTFTFTIPVRRGE